jgi:hypothetical protein
VSTGYKIRKRQVFARGGVRPWRTPAARGGLFLLLHVDTRSALLVELTQEAETMAETEQVVLEQLDHITEELAHVKKYVLLHTLEHKKQAKAAWQKLVKASQRVQWDRMSAVEEIRRQRGRGPS